MKWLKLIILSIILLLFMVELPIGFGLTTRRISFLIAVVYLFQHKKEVSQIWKWNIDKKKVRFFNFLMLFCAFVNIIDVAIAPYSHYAKYLDWYGYIYYYLYVLIFGLFCVCAFRSSKKFILAWAILMAFQAIIVLLSMNSITLRLFLYEYFYTGDNRMDNSVQWGTRLMGVGLHSAVGSLVMSSACIMLVYLKLREQINTILFFFLYSLIFLGTIFMGRTGMLVELAVLIVYLFISKSTKVKILVVVGSLIGIVYLLSWLQSSVSEHTYNWITLQSSNIETTLSGASKTGWAPFNSELIFGSGIYQYYEYQGNLYKNDSGYMSMYIALGVIGSLAYYYGLFNLLSCPKVYSNRRIRIFLTTLIAFAYVVEIKDMFFWSYIFIWMIFTLRLFDSFEYSNGSKVQLKNLLMQE